MHIPLADSPQDENRRDSRTAMPLSAAGVKEGRRASVSDSEILKIIMVDVEHGSAGWSNA